MSAPYTVQSAPSHKSWIYHLDTAQSVAQCRAFGIEPTQELRLNRKLLSNFMQSVIAGRPPLPPASESLIDSDLPLINPALTSIAGTSQLPPPSPSTASIFAESSLAWDYGPPYAHPQATSQPLPVLQPFTTTTSTMPRVPFSLNYVTAASTRPSTSTGGPIRVATFATAHTSDTVVTTAALPQVQPSQQHPMQDQQWAHLIQATATAVGSQMAAVLQANQPPPRVYGDGGSRVLGDLVRSVPETSGSDSVALVRFLAAVQRIAELRIGDHDSLLLALLSKTSGQLRSLWTRAITNRVPLGELIPSLLNFFVPHQLRHSLVTKLVYRAQAVTESIPEFVSDLQIFASLLLPDLPERDILDAALHGLHPATRARMAGLPTPAVLEDLLALAPRIELVRQLEPPPTLARPGAQEPRYFNRPNLDQPPCDFQRDQQRSGFRPNGYVTNGTYQTNNPPRFRPPPFPTQGHRTNRPSANLNFRGGRR